MSDKSLSIRQDRFVREFLEDGNATRAYIRAGYSARGAQPSASRLLTQPHIAAAIAALKARDHRKQEQRVAPRPRRPAPGLRPRDRKRYEERCAAYECALNHSKAEQRWLEWELNETRAALAEAHATIDAAEALRVMENHSNRRECRDA